MASTINADTSNGVIITPDTSGEIELQANGVTKAKVTANGLQDANGNSLRGGMYRNLVINGDMQIAQRGTSATGLGNGSAGYHTADRWRFSETGAPTCEFTQSQDTDVPNGQGFSSSLKMDCTTSQGSLAAADQIKIEQRIEAQNLQHLKFGTSNAETVTVSFWVKSNKTGTYILNIYQADDDRSISKSYTINSADTWEKKTITIEGDVLGTINNDNGLGWYVIWALAMGSDYTSGTLQTSWGAYTAANYMVGQVNLADSTSNYINITGVQLEVGEGASDFEFLPYDVQLQRCQRYYYQVDSYGFINMTTNVYNGTIVKFPVSMRATPTCTLYSTTTGTSGKIYYQDGATDVNAGASPASGTEAVYARVSNVSTNTGSNMFFKITASSEL